MRTDVRETTMSVSMPEEPAWIEIDPHMGVLAEINVDAPEAWWVRAAEAGATYNARVLAWRTLAKLDSEAGLGAMRHAARNTGLHRQERIEIVKALGARRDGPTLIAMISGGESDGFVRAEIVTQLGRVAADEATPTNMRTLYGATLLEWFAREPGGRARANAVRGLANMGHERAVDAMHRAAAQLSSQHQVVPQAAIDAAEKLDLPESLAVVLDLAAPGRLDRTRGRAVGAIPSLAHHDPEAAFQSLAVCAGDAAPRVRGAARRGLVRLGDARGVDVLRRLADAARWKGDKEALERQIEQLEAKLKEQAERPNE
jgi:hypothetical protein